MSLNTAGRWRFRQYSPLLFSSTSFHLLLSFLLSSPFSNRQRHVFFIFHLRCLLCPWQRRKASRLHSGSSCRWRTSILTPAPLFFFLSSPISDSISFQYDPLVQPALLCHEIVSSAASQQTIASARHNSARILSGNDDRILVIVGPCSIHSPEQAIDYAKLLKSKMPEWGNLLIVMRAYL